MEIRTLGSHGVKLKPSMFLVWSCLVAPWLPLLLSCTHLFEVELGVEPSINVVSWTLSRQHEGTLLLALEVFRSSLACRIATGLPSCFLTPYIFNSSVVAHWIRISGQKSTGETASLRGMSTSLQRCVCVCVCVCVHR